VTGLVPTVVAYDAAADALSVQTSDMSLNSTESLVLIETYLTDYPSLKGDPVTVTVKFSDKASYVAPNTPPAFVQPLPGNATFDFSRGQPTSAPVLLGVLEDADGDSFTVQFAGLDSSLAPSLNSVSKEVSL